MANDCGEANLITIISREGEPFVLPAHLLTRESEYFRGLLLSGMKESLQREKAVNIPLLSSAGLQKFSDFIKKSSGFMFKWEEMESVLQTANYLQAEGFLRCCVEFLSNHLSADKCHEVMRLGESLLLPELVGLGDRYRKRHIKAYAHTDSFKEMHMDELLDLLKCDALGEGNEVDVLKAVITWTSRNRDERVQGLRTLLEEVRWGLLDEVQLGECRSLLEAENLADEADAYLAVAAEIGRCISTSALPATIGTHWRRVRQGKPALVALGGFGGKTEHSSNRFQVCPLDKMTSHAMGGGVCQTTSGDRLVYDGDAASGSARRTRQCNRTTVAKTMEFHCSRSEKLPVTLCEHSACVLDNFLYLAGGQERYYKDGRCTVNKAWRYDAGRSAWNQVRSMRAPRSLFCLLPLAGHLYAVCGWKTSGIVNKTVERYDPSTDSWNNVASLDIGLHEHSGCAHRGFLFVCGGFKGPYRGHLDQTWKYDPDGDIWRQMAPLLQSRSYHVTVSLAEADRILVIGGVNYIGDETFEDIKTCELFDPEVNQWTVITRVPRPASCMSSAVCNGGKSVFTFGGHSFQEDADHTKIQILDTENWSWRDVEMKTQGILYFESVVMDIPEYRLAKWMGKR